MQIAAQENGPPAGKAINLSVESTVYADLAPVVGKLRDYVENELGDTIDVEDGRPAPGIDWQITIDRVAAAKYGIGVRELSPYVQLVTGGRQASAHTGPMMLPTNSTSGFVCLPTSAPSTPSTRCGS